MWRETLAVIWHWVTTSRYTRRLEQEIKWLIADNDRLRADNDALMKAMSPALRNARTEYQVAGESKKAVVTNFRW